MECDLCNRRDTPKVGLHCPVCSRTALYPIRLETARLLLEKGVLNEKIEQIISGQPLKEGSEDGQALSRAWNSESRKMHLQAIKERVETQKSELSNSQAEIRKLRDEIEQKRITLAQGKKSLEIIQQRLPTRQHQLIEKLNQIGNRGVRSFDSIHNSSVETRAFLCREVANLLGLSYQKRVDAERIRHYFLIAGHAIPNLRSLHRKFSGRMLELKRPANYAQINDVTT